ncbi:hypothetical protein CALVIDRAFT_89645 [Calocera viscosa TUFC12733]|uniref:Uncharacterized protein n=1 Tax=Calocera viscosa (strain TUFC12733) TaxID=1330018 RepID=A0A167MRU3_CALVF|nr:hypothetical protein CALVIDRAFT_89645 [Calocera viscosa TUFC12733]
MGLKGERVPRACPAVISADPLRCCRRTEGKRPEMTAGSGSPDGIAASRGGGIGRKPKINREDRPRGHDMRGGCRKLALQMITKKRRVSRQPQEPQERQLQATPTVPLSYVKTRGLYMPSTSQPAGSADPRLVESGSRRDWPLLWVQTDHRRSSCLRRSQSSLFPESQSDPRRAKRNAGQGLRSAVVKVTRRFLRSFLRRAQVRSSSYIIPRFISIESGGVPYPAFRPNTIPALVLWQLLRLSDAGL